MKLIKLSIAAVALLSASMVQAMPTPFPGPNDFGYVGSEIDFNLRNIRTSGTELSLSDDSVSGLINFGFTFDFYGIPYTGAYISSNGFLSLSNPSSSGCCTGQVLGDEAGLDNLIAGLWEDLDPPEGGTLRYQTIGDEFIVGFYAIQHWPGGSPVTFEMILNGATNDIEFHYDSLQNDGGIHTLGITNIGDSDDLTLYRGRNINQFADEGYLISAPTSGGPIPEPSALALFGLGILSLAFVRRRTKV